MEQLQVFHSSSHKFTRRDKATRMFYLQRTMDEVISKNRCSAPKLELIDLDLRRRWEYSGERNVRQVSPLAI